MVAMMRALFISYHDDDDDDAGKRQQKVQNDTGARERHVIKVFVKKRKTLRSVLNEMCGFSVCDDSGNYV